MNMGRSSEQLREVLANGWMLVLAFLVGLVAGFGALIFRAMIGFVHNLSFNGTFSFSYNADLHTNPSVWGWLIIFVPVIGAVVVTWLTQTFAKEARGHGVPEVMNAIYYQKGKIRATVAVIKSIASAISIGTGGSVGREGPIIQIGAAFGSIVGQILKLPPRQIVVLIAAGGAAGIAATFNAPVGGLAFAMELLLISLSAVNVALVIVATVTATLISRMFLGMGPSFYVPNLSMVLNHVMHAGTLFLFIPFGLIMGLAAALFIRCIYWFEDGFDSVIKNPYLRHMTGMFFLGVMLYALLRFTGYYYVDGVSYSTILDVLRGVLSDPWLLLLLFVCKLMATSLTLGSGASGGVFSPSLFLGACLGATFAILLQHLFPGMDIRTSLFAVAGMAAMVGGTTGAVVTAIIMTVEQTRDYADILPIMLTVGLTYAVRVRICRDSIYTLKLLRRGKMIPQGLQAAISGNKQASHLMTTDFKIVPNEELKTWAAQHNQEQMPFCMLVTDNDIVSGVIYKTLDYLRADMDIDKLIHTNTAVITKDVAWPKIVRLMQEKKAAVVLVSKKADSQKASDIIGVITERELVASSQETAQLLD